MKRLFSILAFIIFPFFYLMGQGDAKPTLRLRITEVSKEGDLQADVRISWDVSDFKGDFSQLGYLVELFKNESRNAEETKRVQERNVVFKKLKKGENYKIKVSAVLASNNQTIGCDSVSVMLGCTFRCWNPFSGQFPLRLLKRGEIFEESTLFGKIAFHLIWWFLWIGIVIWGFFCWKNLRLSKIFPFGKFSLAKSFGDAYKKRAEDFEEKIIKKWKKIIEKNNQYISMILNNRTPRNMAEILRKNVRYWNRVGRKRIRNLINYLDHGTVRGKKYSEYPIIKILKAGLENHELGGFRWLEVSEEVDRAIENQAAAEISKLRRKTLVEWLWNIGTLSPLVGLFGTATGLSSSFQTIAARNSTNIDMTELARGIYEAIWTTIFGLVVGFTLMLVYYYYDNKLKWIYSKWEEIYVDISKNL